MGNEQGLKTTGNASIMLDTMTMNLDSNPLVINDTAIDAVNQESIMLPDGSSYSPPVGYLAIGSNDKVRQYPNGTGQIIPNYLFAQSVTPSASVGLHYGSGLLGPKGSLIWGGYDSSRAIGDVAQFSLSRTALGPMTPNLVDIQVGVESGGSPFPQPSYQGLLSLNGSFGLYQPAVINPMLPYLFFSPATCANIARLLPVTLQPLSGLYTWNVDDPQYHRIITSPSYLALVFRTGSVNNGNNAAASNLTIKIPFALLNLTLDSPISQSSVPYLPLYPNMAPSGDYFLGRAFMQAAFLGINLNQSSYFLAQGPGPDVDSENITAIQPGDNSLQGSPASKFAESWARHWTPLPVTPSSSISSPTASHENRLSSGAIAGIVVGVILGVALLFSWAFLLLLRQRRHKKKVNETLREGNEKLARSPSGTFEKDGNTTPTETDGHRRYHEAPAHDGRLEVDSTEKAKDTALRAEVEGDATENDTAMYEMASKGENMRSEASLPELPTMGTMSPLRKSWIGR